jgi:hypothetical protein
MTNHQILISSFNRCIIIQVLCFSPSLRLYLVHIPNSHHFYAVGEYIQIKGVVAMMLAIRGIRANAVDGAAF